MTDPCTPPPGTKRKGWHVLEYADGERNERYWIGGCWWWYDKTAIKCPKNVADLWVVGCNPCAPKRMTGAGWRYIGPVEANTPTGIPADWADCAQCGARRFYPSGQCMQYCDKKPSPPDAKDALLREALKWLGVETPMVGWAEIELENLRVRIHQQLEGK